MARIDASNTITLEELTKNHYTFAPSKYSNKKAADHKNFATLEDLITLDNTRAKIQDNVEYKYVEIGDIDVSTGRINYESDFGVRLPTSSPIKLRTGDILISTVRTYRKGIGIVTLDDDNIVCTPAFLVIRDVTEKITKEYLYAILRHDYFVEQILSLQNRGMYPRLDRNTTNLVPIPLPDNSDTLKYISKLQNELITRNQEIQDITKRIISEIENELLSHQSENEFKYQFPTLKVIKNLSRIDTGIYTEEFLGIDFIIKNYKNGYYTVPESKIKSGSTPIKRFIGTDPSLKYHWLTPTQLSDFGTIISEERINCQNNNIDKNSLLLVNRTSKGGRGEYVGIGMFYDVSIFGKAHHNQGIYRITDYSDNELKFMSCFMNIPMMRKYCAGMCVGSKMKEIKSSQFATIPFPKFPLNAINSIAELYSKIITIDLSVKKIQRQLDKSIKDVINGDKVVIDYSSL